MHILIAQINPIVGDLAGNTALILEHIDYAKKEKVQFVLFPELALSGYPPEDLLFAGKFIEKVERQLETIVPATKGITALIGLPRQNPGRKEKFLHNSAAILHDGKLLGFHDKVLLPTYDVFDERRYFEPGEGVTVWNIGGVKIAVTICEDIWQHGEELRYTSYRTDPILALKKEAPAILFNLSASPYRLLKPPQRLQVCKKANETLSCPVVLCNQVGGNDSLIFDGHSLALDAKGSLIWVGEGFNEDRSLIDFTQKHDPITFHSEPVKELYRALVLGTRDYFYKQGFTKACIGLSGGIDSAVVACIAKEALGSENILGIMMPSRYSSGDSLHDASELARNLRIRVEEIPIESPFQCYLDLLQPYFEGKGPDTTEENLQARIRGMILMALSNKHGYLVLSTGNKSEMAVGYSTLYGDLCGGLSVLGDVTKMQVYAIANFINTNEEIIPKNILLKPPSAELRPDQKDADSLPPYPILDDILNDYIINHLSPEEIAQKHQFSPEMVHDIVHRIHQNEYKRRQSPPGLRVSEKAFSVGRRFPIVQKWL